MNFHGVLKTPLQFGIIIRIPMVQVIHIVSLLECMSIKILPVMNP